MAGNEVNYERHPDYEKIWPLLREVDGPVTARARFPQWKVNGPAHHCGDMSSYFLVACKKGDLRVAKALFKMGANVAAKNRYGETALISACSGKEESRAALVEWLLMLEDGLASMDDVDNVDHCVLYTAITNSNKAVVRMLLCFGHDGMMKWSGFSCGAGVSSGAKFARRFGAQVMAQMIEDWKEPEVEEWRPWNAERAPAKFRGALRALLLLAKASIQG